MAILTGSRESRRSMVGVIGVVVFALVASEAGVWGIVVIAIVAGGAIVLNGSMGPVQLIIIVVDGERSRHPIGVGRMAHGTVHWDGQC